MFDLTPFFLKHQLDLTAPLLVAFSGGSDSLALLCLLVEQLGASQVKALYVNHALRPEKELEREIELNVANCQRLNVPLQVVTLAVGEVETIARQRRGGLEEAARYLRRQALERYRITHNIRYIATGHTLDDQAETVVMNLLHGGSVPGPKGIREVLLPYIRPLLGYRKEELIALLKAKGFSWSEDSTNEETLFRRNQIRHQLIPTLAAQQPAYREILARLGEQNALVHDFIDQEAKRCEQGVMRLQESAIVVNLPGYRSLEQVIRYQLLYRAWNTLQRQSEEAEARRFPFESVQRADSFLMADGEVGKQLDLVGCSLMREHQQVLFRGNLKDAVLVVPESIMLKLSREKYFFQKIVWQERWVLIRARLAQPVGLLLPKLWHNRLTLWLDEGTLQGELTLRSAGASETVELIEGRKSLRKLFNEWKIPRSEWPLIPLLALDKEIIAVLGSAFGGRDRLCKRMLNNGNLDRKGLTLYSVVVEKD